MEKDNEENTVSQPHAQKILGKLKENRNTLFIQRIPEQTKKAFIEFAHAEFCGDYGMALKWLLDDVPGQDVRMLISSLENHEARITALESNVESKPGIPEKSTPSRKMVDGKTPVPGRDPHG